MEFLHQNITIKDVDSAFSLELPAEKAHKKMLPEGRVLTIPPDVSAVYKSAVLVLLLKRDEELCFCFTRRNQHLKHHPGQISFPGGKIDEEDNDVVRTALRELFEEIGVDESSVSILGSLSELYVQVSNFLIYPVVGFIDYEPLFKINYDEVEEVIILPFDKFLNEENVSTSIVKTSIGKLEVPCYIIDGVVIWGATAMIISEFSMLLTSYYRRKE